MYVFPTAARAVSDSFADHLERGSVNPGTDYICYRVPVVSVAAGVVTDVDGNPSGSGGRMVHVDHDDGTGADYLHLDGISVSRGDRVAQGQKLGISGNSGDPVGGGVYGFHLHISFRRRHGAAYTNAGNIDFDALMHASAAAGGTAQTLTTPTPDQEGDTMRTLKSKQTGAVYNIGELTYQKLDTLDQGSQSAHVWNGTSGAGEPTVVDQAVIDVEIGQVQKRRAQFAAAFRQLTS